MSDTNADRTASTPEHESSMERPSNVVDETNASPTPQADIAAEQAEASLDARDDAAAQDESATQGDAAGLDHATPNEVHAEPEPLIEPEPRATAAYEPVPNATAAYEPVAQDAPVVEGTPVGANESPTHDEAPVYAAPAVAAMPRAAEPAPHAPAAVEPAPYAPIATPTATQSPAQSAAQQRAFTPPPVAPKKKGNRAIGALIAIMSVVVFVVVFAVVAAIVIAAQSPAASVTSTLLQFITSPVFYVPAIFFVIGFVIVALLANRANWWAYIIGSLFVAAIVYFGTIGVGLLVSGVVTLTPGEAQAQFIRSATNPFIIAAALVAREVSMWMGAAISARGRRMTARNQTVREEYERAAAEHRAEYERGFTPA